MLLLIMIILILQLLHRNIDLVEKKPVVGTLGGGTVTIKCKDFQIIHLDISNGEDFLNAADSIEALSNVGRLKFIIVCVIQVFCSNY